MKYSFPYYHQPAHTQSSTLGTTSFLLSTTQEVEAETLVEDCSTFSLAWVCVSICNFNTPGIDHKMPLPDVPGKWPWSWLPLPGQSAIPFAEVREKRGGESSCLAASARRRQFALDPPLPLPALPGLAWRPRRGAAAQETQWAHGAQALGQVSFPCAGAQALAAHTFPSASNPAMLPGDRKRRKTTSLVLGPLLSSSTSRSSAKREDIPYTHTHTLTTPSPTSCCSQAIPGCLLARGGMLVRRAPGARRAGTSPGRLMGKERRKNQKSLLAKTQKLGTSWPKAHERAAGSWPGTPRPPSPTRACPEPSCTPAAPVPFSARRMTRALLQRQLWGFLSI